MKQRLIDANALMRLLPSEEMVSKYSVANAPTVKAIPVEWIDRWSKQFWKEINGKKYYMGDGYDTVWDMIEAWEAENGKE